MEIDSVYARSVLSAAGSTDNEPSAEGAEIVKENASSEGTDDSAGVESIEKGKEDVESEEEAQTKKSEFAEDDKVREAEDVLRLVKEDPEGFARKYGVDTFGSRFAALARQSSELRQREQNLKLQEQRIREADALLSSLKSDPVAFAEEHLGQDGYERWTASILGKDKSETAVVNKLMSKIDELEQKLTQSVTASSRQSEYDARASKFWGDYASTVSDSKYDNLKKFVGENELQQETLKVQGAALEHGKWLTPVEILNTLHDELEFKLNELGFAHSSAVEEPKKKTPPPKEDLGSATVTSELRSAASRLSDDPEWDKLSDREQMRRITARYK